MTVPSPSLPKATKTVSTSTTSLPNENANAVEAVSPSFVIVANHPAIPLVPPSSPISPLVRRPIALHPVERPRYHSPTSMNGRAVREVDQSRRPGARPLRRHHGDREALFLDSIRADRRRPKRGRKDWKRKRIDRGFWERGRLRYWSCRRRCKTWNRSRNRCMMRSRRSE